MAASANGRSQALPAGIALLSTVVGALLFFTTTVPAARERSELRRIEAEHVRLRDELASRLDDLRRQNTAIGEDPQTLLLAIDAAGSTPAELLGESIPGMPAVPAWTNPK